MKMTPQVRLALAEALATAQSANRLFDQVADDEELTPPLVRFLVSTRSQLVAAATALPR